MDFETEMLKITEAYAIEHNLPVKRKFTHDELAESLQAVRKANLAVEDQIMSMYAFDYDTAWELLHAIEAKLKCRYENLDDTAVGEAFKNLDKALCDAFGMPTNRSEHERETDRDDTSQHLRTRERPPARGR